MEAQMVVGAVIVSDGRVLAARRSRPADLAGFWEFPGGKVEPGEDPGTALVREVSEELGATIAVLDELGELGELGEWPISDGCVLRLLVATVAGGVLTPGADHDELRWLAVDDLESVDWLPSDLAALGAVRARLGRALE